METKDLPDEYWVIQTTTSFLRVDHLQASKVLEELHKIKQLVDAYRLVTIYDIAGSTVNLVLDAVNEIYFSNPEIREVDRLFQKKHQEESERPW